MKKRECYIYSEGFKDIREMEGVLTEAEELR